MSQPVNSPNRNHSKKPYGSTQYVTYTDTETGRKKTYEVERGAAPPVSGIIGIISVLFICGLLISVGLFPIAILLGIITLIRLFRN